jgi:hypothetical protein
MARLADSFTEHVQTFTTVRSLGLEYEDHLLSVRSLVDLLHSISYQWQQYGTDENTVTDTLASIRETTEDVIRSMERRMKARLWLDFDEGKNVVKVKRKRRELGLRLYRYLLSCCL